MAAKETLDIFSIAVSSVYAPEFYENLKKATTARMNDRMNEMRQKFVSFTNYIYLYIFHTYIVSELNEKRTVN